MRKTGALLIIFLVITGGFLLVGQVFAQEGRNISITISPLTFELTANPGDTLVNKLKVLNPTGSVLLIKMEVEDFQPVGEIGEVIVMPEEEMTYSLKRWVRTEPSEFTLEPGEQKFVDFIIEVPGDAEPGGKYGSILATTAGTISEGITGPVIAQKVGALVLMTVSGEVKESLRIKEFSAPKFLEYGPVPFVIRFENSGTVHVRPRGFITITNWRGKKVTDIDFPQLNVIPGAVRKVEAKWDTKWLFGKYAAILVGSYGTTNTPLNPSVLTFWVVPWKVSTGILLALIVIFIFFFKSRRRWILALKVLFKGRIQ